MNPRPGPEPSESASVSVVVRRWRIDSVACSRASSARRSASTTGVWVAVAGVGLLVGLWGARCGVRAADECAADCVWADAVADALGRYAAVHNMEPSRRRVPNPLSVNAAIGDRIDHPRDCDDDR